MTMQTMPPVSDINLFTDEVLIDPYSAYAELRALGPVVHLPHHDVLAITQYEALRTVATSWEQFTSVNGVGFNPTFNSATEGTLICSDPPDHRNMRKVLERPLLPGALKDIEPFIKKEARVVVERLVAQGQFDAATDLAQHLPLTVVSKLVGLGDQGRAQMLEWAAAAFDALGPENDRTMRAMPKAQEMVGFALNQAKPGTIDPKGWAAALYTAAGNGEIKLEQCPFMVVDYTAPSLDTTILGTGSLLYLLATHPEQWQLLRKNPVLVRHAVNEALRLESPIQRFSRVTNHEVTLANVTIPSGSRLMLLYGSANRDDRKYSRPDSFDIMRKPSDQLAFGTGEHACAGMHLARLEIRSLIEELIPRVESFELVSAERVCNNLLLGYSKVEVRVIPTSG